MLDDSPNDAIAALPCWSGKLEIAPLVGGITNRNYLVTAGLATDGRRQRFVVRMGRDIPEHGVLRFNELAAARAAQAAGISPEVIYASNGILVSRFIDGQTLTPADVRQPERLVAIVALLRRCHYDIPRHFQGPALIFWVFQVIRNYLHLLAERDANPYALSLESLARKCEHLEQVLGPVTMVFGHNDLLAANLMDDGQRLWLIDWDYAGFNSPLFDLANLASNNEFTAELEAQLLEQYFAGSVSDHHRRGFAAMQCASLLRETLWGAVSRLTSSIDFDYLAYAHDYLARFERSWQQFAAHHG
jgi:thiamine kinase-like enzyme